MRTGNLPCCFSGSDMRSAGAPTAARGGARAPRTEEKFFDRAIAGALAEAAAASYGEEEDMKAWATAQGLNQLEVIRDAGTDTVVFVAGKSGPPSDPPPQTYGGQADGGCVVVAFRGTADLHNWITDLDCRRVRTHSSDRTDRTDRKEVHAGFAGAMESVWASLRETLSRLAAAKEDIFFTGHSLGGALAMLAAARMQSEECIVRNGNSSLPTPHSPLAWVYTFGQPRVGNGAWARWYDTGLRERSFRIVHADDVVPRVPWLLRMFRHAGTEVYFPEVQRAQCAADGAARRPYLVDPPWWRKFIADAPGLWLEARKGKLALLADHHVDTYVKLLSP